MKRLFTLLMLFIPFSTFADDNLIEFNVSQSPVVYQLNRNTGSLNGIIKDNPHGICLYNMNFKHKDNNNNIFVYERNDVERGRNLYQRLEVNLISNNISIFTSFRNANSTIPIEKRSCSVFSCTNINNLPSCIY